MPCVQHEAHMEPADNVKKSIDDIGDQANSVDSGSAREQGPLTRAAGRNDPHKAVKTRPCGASSPTGS